MVLRNAKIFTQGHLVAAGIAIENGRIYKIAKETNLPSASSKLNLKGSIAIPGLIDAHVHLRDQKLAYKEDFFSGTAAAAAGGVTSIIDMPNNNPTTMDSASLKGRMKLAQRRVITNIAFYSAFPENLVQIPLIVKDGAVAFKLFMSKKIGGVDPDDDFKLLQAFHHVKKTGVPVAIHAEDRDTINKNTKKMENSGRSDLEAYARAHPPTAEVKAIAKVLQLGNETGIHIHICHLSTFAGLKIIQDAKKSGTPLTCEVTPHHLLLPLIPTKHYGNLGIVNPPLRPKADAEALWAALQRGSIDIVASDHAPHAIDEKEKVSIWGASPGIPGLETLLPLFLTQVNNGIISLSDLVRLTSENPARIFDLINRGSLDPGYRADITVVDINRKFEIDSSEFFSKAKHSPYDGWSVKGRPIKTFVNGRLVMDEGEIVAKPGTAQIIVAGTHTRNS